MRAKSTDGVDITRCVSKWIMYLNRRRVCRDAAGGWRRESVLQADRRRPRWALVRPPEYGRLQRRWHRYSRRRFPRQFQTVGVSTPYSTSALPA